jgi:hypothetical protein
MDTSPTEPLSKEETAFLIRSFWEALLGPAWLKDDLIALGKLVFAKVRLRDIEPEMFQRLLPHLTAIANTLGPKVLKMRLNSVSGAAVTPATTPPKTTPPATPPTPAPPTDLLSPSPNEADDHGQ